MSARLQLALTVAAAAVAVAGGVIGITLATRDHPPKLQPQPGKPPVPKSLPGPVGAAVRQALVDWPKGSLPALQRISRDNPKVPLARLYLGIGLLWAGYVSDAEAALEQAKKLGRDTRWEIAADDILHPQFFTGYPVFAPLERNPLLLQGERLQTQGKQHSAERVYQRAARLAPDDDEAQVAAAVGRFDKDNLTASFSHLGPLTKRFPKSQIVRFYLGLLLAWTGQGEQACVQFRKTVALGTTTQLGGSAKAFLTRVCSNGTSGSKK